MDGQRMNEIGRREEGGDCVEVGKVRVKGVIE